MISPHGFVLCSLPQLYLRSITDPSPSKSCLSSPISSCPSFPSSPSSFAVKALQEHRISDGERGSNVSFAWPSLQDLIPLASSDGPMPLLSSPLQSHTSTSSDLPSIVASEVNQPPLRPKLLLPLQIPELQPQICQVVKSSPFDPFPEASLQMEMELPSNQSHHGIMKVNALLRADQQITMDQFVGLNHVSSFQFDLARNQIVIVAAEPSQISRSNCGAFVINESQGENTDSSIDGVSSNHPTGMRIHTFEEDITKHFVGRAFSLACLPSVCSSALPLQAMPIQQVSEISVAKKQLSLCDYEMAHQEHHIFDGEGEAKFHSLGHLPNMTIPFLPEFDPSSQFERIADNLSMSPYQLQDLNPLASSDDPMPLLWSPLQSHTSTSFESLPSLVASEVKQPPLRPKLLSLQKPELQQQIDQVVKSSPFDPFPEASLQMKMELPSNQSHHGHMNTLIRADQQITMDQFFGMHHVSSFQFDPERFVIDESQGENTDSSLDGVSSNYPTWKRIHAFEEDITKPFDDSAFSLAFLPSVCSSVLPLQAMPIQQVSEISVAKKEKIEIGGREASATPTKAVPFYNFMKLPHDIYVAQRNALVNR